MLICNALQPVTRLDIFLQFTLDFIQAAQEVPIIVEAATASFLPTLRHPFRKRLSFFDKVRLFFAADGEQKDEIHRRTMSVMENLRNTGKAS